MMSFPIVVGSSSVFFSYAFPDIGGWTGAFVGTVAWCWWNAETVRLLTTAPTAMLIDTFGLSVIHISLMLNGFPRPEKGATASSMDSIWLNPPKASNPASQRLISLCAFLSRIALRLRGATAEKALLRMLADVLIMREFRSDANEAEHVPLVLLSPGLRVVDDQVLDALFSQGFLPDIALCVMRPPPLSLKTIESLQQVVGPERNVPRQSNGGCHELFPHSVGICAALGKCERLVDLAKRHASAGSENWLLGAVRTHSGTTYRIEIQPAALTFAESQHV